MKKYRIFLCLPHVRQLFESIQNTFNYHVSNKYVTSFHAYYMNWKLEGSHGTSYPKCMFRAKQVKVDPDHCKHTSSQKLAGLIKSIREVKAEPRVLSLHSSSRKLSSEAAESKTARVFWEGVAKNWVLDPSWGCGDRRLCAKEGPRASVLTLTALGPHQSLMRTAFQLHLFFHYKYSSVLINK